MMGHTPKMVNTLTFAITVPNLVIGATSEWLLSLPLSWLFHHDYFGEGAMRGKRARPSPSSGIFMFMASASHYNMAG
jgi:hypothetical protein